MVESVRFLSWGDTADAVEAEVSLIPSHELLCPNPVSQVLGEDDARAAMSFFRQVFAELPNTRLERRSPT